MSDLHNRIVIDKEKGQRMSKGIEWVVTMVAENGEVVRGVQTAYLGHPAIKFFAERKGINYKGASAEKMTNFQHFLAKGLRNPLTPEELE
jgi:hypothetical protein